MKRQAAFTFLLIVVTSVAARSAEPITSTATKQSIVGTTKTNIPLAQTSEEKIAALAALVAQQQSQINSLQQQLTNQGNAIEMQISECEELSDRVSVFEQVFSFSNGVLSIDFEAIEINTDDLWINAQDVEIDCDLRVRGKLRADKVKTDSIDSKTYTPGAGNVW